MLSVQLQQVTRLNNFQVTLNSTRQELEEMKEVWEAVNATKEHIEQNVWGALNKTQGELVQFNNVWIVVNSTKEEVQQQKEMSHNLTAEVRNFCGLCPENNNKVD